jgi:hypothetical protein
MGTAEDSQVHVWVFCKPITTVEWKEKSRHMSNTAQMAMLRSYQKIIGMGWDAVPFLLEELQREPDQWFWALEAITDQNPVPPEVAGKVRENSGLVPS